MRSTSRSRYRESRKNQFSSPTRLGRGAVLRTATVDQLGRRVELLAPDAVRALVPAAVEVAVRAPRPARAARPRRAWRGSALVRMKSSNEMLERVAQRFERRRVPVDEVPRGHACCLGAEHVLQRVVVGAAEEAHRSARGASLPGEHVGLDELERVPHVRARVDIGNRNGDVAADHRASSRPPRTGGSIRGPGLPGPRHIATYSRSAVAPEGAHHHNGETLGTHGRSLPACGADVPENSVRRARLRSAGSGGRAANSASSARLSTDRVPTITSCTETICRKPSRDHPAFRDDRRHSGGPRFLGARDRRAERDRRHRQRGRAARRRPGVVGARHHGGRHALSGTVIASWDGWRGAMYRLAVLPSLRRRGIAAALVDEGERRLQA